MEWLSNSCASLRRALVLCLSLAISPLAWADTATTQPEAARQLRDQAVARASELINNIRNRLDACGDKGMLAAGAATSPVPARPALQWNERLARAAHQHASAMVEQGFFAHRNPDGTTVGDRVSERGYRWRQVGENLAAGLPTIDDAVREWLLSSTHCEVLIGPRFTEFGLAQVRSSNPGDLYGTYWALVVAQPR